jgi:hypothetical protein
MYLSYLNELALEYMMNNKEEVKYTSAISLPELPLSALFGYPLGQFAFAYPP